MRGAEPTERHILARAVVTFLFILVSLGAAGWIVWSNHDTAVHAERNGQHIGSLQHALTAEQRELKAALHTLALLQHQASASNCNAISITNASMRKAVRDLTEPLPITPGLKPDAVQLRQQSNAQKAVIRAVFVFRFPPVHYDGHRCAPLPTRAP